MNNKSNRISDDVSWIGVDNPEGRDFHGVYTPRGGSYNSYLVNDEKPTIIDGINTPFLAGYMDSLKSMIDPGKVAYIIINHAENDHAGAIKELMKECNNANVVCTEKCKEFLVSAFGADENRIKTVKKGDELSIGKKRFIFYPDPMVHWPETMISYLVEDKLLFSSDLFGTEVSHESLFADEMDDFTELTRDYYAIVMRPFHAQVKKAIDIVKGLEINTIAPSHGPVYRKELNRIIDYYDKLSVSPEEDKVLIAYYSVWHSTEKMAEEIAKGVNEAGFQAKVFDIKKANMVSLMAEAMTSKAVALGSLTMLSSYHVSFETLLGLLKANNQAKKALVFGTHGWMSAAVPKLSAKLKDLGYEVIAEIDQRFGPQNDEDLTILRDNGKKIVEVARNAKS